MIRKVLDWLASNWTTLLISLLLALAVWIVATLEENPIQETDLQQPVPINVEGLGPGLLITNDYPETTRVRIRAQQETRRNISAEDVQVIADLSGRGPGTYQIALEAEINGQARITAMNPGLVRFVVEERTEREIPVQVVQQGEIPASYELGDPRAVPSFVTVEGPRSKVQLISEVRATVSVDDQRANIVAHPMLEALDKDGNAVEGVTITPNTITVTVPLIQREDYRDFPVKVLYDGQIPPGYFLASIDVTPRLITVQGDPTVIASMPPYINTEFIDLTGRTDDFTVDLLIELPVGVTVVGDPAVSVLVTIGVQQGNRQVQRVPIVIEGLDPDLEAEITPLTVDLLLSGPLPSLDSLNPFTDVRVTIDLSDLGIGVHQVVPDVNIAGSDIAIQVTFPQVIEVQIKRKPR